MAIFNIFAGMVKSVTPILRVPSFDTYGRSVTPCKLCGNSASYQFNLPGQGETALCSSHASTLEAILKSTPEIDVSDKSLLLSAANDLDEAYEIDPSAEGVRENRKNVKEMVERFCKPKT